MTQILRPISDDFVEGNIVFTPPSPATVWDKLDEATADDDVTKVVSDVPIGGGGNQFGVKFGIPQKPLTGTGKLKIRYKRIGEDDDYNLTLKQGGVFLESWFIDLNSFPESLEWSTIEFVIGESKIDNITGLVDLGIDWGDSSRGSESDVVHISWIEIEIPDPSSPFTPPVRATIDSVIHPRNVDSIILKDEELDSIMNM